jgi:CBS domain-containing protein
MTVARIIGDKGRAVVTAAPNATIDEIAKTLAQRKIGAIVLIENGGIRGIVSERDVVRAVAAEGSAALQKRATDYMTTKVVTCRLEDTINDVMHKMTAGRFRHLPVLEDGKLAGIVSIGDVVKRRIEDVEREAEQIREYIATA